jgi:hypothetical protein
MTTRERFHATMSFVTPDRLPVIEWATYWDKTVARWREEGLSADITSADEIREKAGLDAWRQHWARPGSAACPRAASHGAGILSDLGEYEAMLPHLYPDTEPVCSDIRRWADRHAAGELVIWLTVEGFFWFPRTLLGIEQHLYAFYDEPELMHRMNRDVLNWNLILFLS